jgi:hypothetical protein
LNKKFTLNKKFSDKVSGKINGKKPRKIPGKIPSKKYLIIIAIIAIIFIALIYNVLASGTHYTSKGEDGVEISFNYPAGWAFQERTAGILIQGEKNGTDNTTNRSVVTIAKVSANSTSVEQIKSNNIYIKTGKITNETNRTVADATAQVIDIDEMAGPERGKLGEVKLVLFSKDNYIYTITFLNGQTVKGLENDINHILNSFNINKT